MTQVHVDFTNITGKIKPVHGMNNCARDTLWGELLPEFKALSAPIVRLHDTGGPYGGSHYVDVPNIFPNFEADPEDENAYDFTLTDLYLKYLVETGCEICYRLGVTIEHAPKKYQIHPPADSYKWASICEHIVRHYNEGWADGYHWNIKYWEIWNEPDGLDPHIEPCGPPMWTGTAQQYYELYSITANYLKEKHPDIRVGGYSSCKVQGAFYQGKWTVGITDFLDGFLDYITAPETCAPLDFFSWHTYIDHTNIRLLSEDAEFAKAQLTARGLTQTECFNTEWNAYLSPDRDVRMVYMRNEMGASHYAAALCEMQNCSAMDKAMFYESSLWAAYGPLFHVPEKKPTKAYHAFRMFGEVYSLQNACAVTGGNDTLYTVASVSEEEGILMICNPEPEGCQVQLTFDGAGGEKAEIFRLDAQQDGDAAVVCSAADCKELMLTPYSVTLVRILV